MQIQPTKQMFILIIICISDFVSEECHFFYNRRRTNQYGSDLLRFNRRGRQRAKRRSVHLLRQRWSDRFDGALVDRS